MLRAEDPGIGGRKIWLMLGDIFDDDWLPGRDMLYQLLRENHLNLKQSKRRHTTNSNHRYHKYTNLIKGLELTRPNQLWVSDITYIDLEEGCCYLHLVTDALFAQDNRLDSVRHIGRLCHDSRPQGRH